jgi:plasmid stabilization system protein ParE
VSKYSLEFLPAAQEELVQAIEWYEKQRQGLGSRFMVAVEATLEAIKRTPMLFTVVNKNVRRARIKRFPFGIFFEFSEERIVVAAIYHARRDPIKVHKRF